MSVHHLYLLLKRDVDKPCSVCCRPIVLERFAVMNTQHQAIVSQLQTLLTQFVAFPKAVTNQELAQCEPELHGTVLPR